ncbi:MAG TPA: 4Fe-4S dicluster domain-containing protein, partial [Reyranella sp.]|nr:4Fe-4S dicluster domain-containing protein [Reyranella sp.]
RFACNAWLQETPKPISKVTWDNIVLLSPRLARERNIVDGAELRIDVNGRSITGPAWIAPGQDPNTLTLTLGYGQERPGTLPHGLGYNAVDLLERGSGFLLVGAGLTPTGRHQLIATTQPEQAMDGFDFVRTVTEPHAAIERTAPQASFYPERKWDSPSWGMSIDLDLCIGCNACLVACVAENNVPMVGKELVSEGRVMHWLRIDHYHEGDPEAPDSSFQPVPCMHCEQAPCEMGCPVNATVHSPDGLNLQVYNRCIGTRTCSAYCPYKVRRFNWFEYTGGDPESIRAMRNPEVTVRSRGVMEKCTYCIQRISAARIAAKIAGQPVADAKVVTACQQACPTQAIVFGDITNSGSEVAKRKAEPRNYALLEEANTRPRTTYLARIRKKGRPS